MNPESFFGPVTVIAVLLALFFIAMAYLRHLGVQRARTQKTSATAKPWQVANPYTASETLVSTAAAPATLAPPSAATKAASDPSRSVFRQFGSVGAGTAAPDDRTPGYVWE
jgi:hypothetical protein